MTRGKSGQGNRLQPPTPSGSFSRVTVSSSSRRPPEDNERTTSAWQRALRLYHTVRWLRREQIQNRITRRLWRPKLPLERLPEPRGAPFAWQLCHRNPSLLGPRTFRFLGETRSISAPRDWNAAETPKLWLYNAHYFDDLVAASHSRRRDWHAQLILDWIGENPPRQGNGWEPYPTSLRIVNWIKHAWSAGGLPVGAERSLALQARWLSRTLEFHLLGDHLWANAKALVFAGTYFDGREAEGWLQTGCRILARELPEQVPPDGGHFE